MKLIRLLLVLASALVWSGQMFASPVTPPPQVVPARVRVSQGIMEGLLLNKVPPVYPEEAKKSKIQGSVVLKTIVNRDGDVQRVELISGHPDLVQAAIDAVQQWKYRPFRLNGQPVEVESQVKINFVFSGN